MPSPDGLKIGNRSLAKVLGAPFHRQHYVAFFNMMRVYPAFIDSFRRYFFATGDYPHRLALRTPCGLLTVMLHTPHDMLTVNEIFCRLDYLAPEPVRCVVDVGSNIGISALYFLTRNSTARAHLFEPDPRNLEKLNANLAGRESRIEVHPVAVTAEDGEVEFGFEPTGRYGGVGLKTGQYLRVKSVGINNLLSRILARERVIDILKLDIEGLELKLAAMIEPEIRRRIRRIYMEACPDAPLFKDEFRQVQYGTVCQLFNLREPG